MKIICRFQCIEVIKAEPGTVVWANGADIAAEYFEEHLVSNF